jgi:hypothetical protein
LLVLNKLKQYIAAFLVSVFAWVLLPAPMVHELFADHEDTAHDFCKTHGHTGLHIEEKHTHCEILKTNTPVYNTPVFVSFQTSEVVLISEINTVSQSGYYTTSYVSIPARGPPAIG